MNEHAAKQKAPANLLEEVRAISELIFDVLYRQGDMSLEHLKSEVHHESPIFDWGLGWLLGKGDIELVSENGVLTARRNPPTPAVIPIRGN